MNLGHAHKTRFWYLLGVLSKFCDERPRLFYRGVPSPHPPGEMSIHRRVVRVLMTYNFRWKSRRKVIHVKVEQNRS